MKAFKHINTAFWCIVGWAFFKIWFGFLNALTLVQIGFAVVVGLVCFLFTYLESPGAFFQPSDSADYTAAVF